MSSTKRSTDVIIVISWAVLVLSIVGWPVTATTVFRDEQQGILGLSWFALIYSAANTLLTAYTKREAEA